MPRVVIKLKKQSILDITVSLASLSLDTQVAGIHDITASLASLTLVSRPVIKLKKSLPIPPLPPYGITLTATQEAFEILREYYALRNEPIPQEDIKWYNAELITEAKEFDDFWERCCVTKAIMESVMRGDDEIAMIKVEMAAKAIQKTQPIRAEDIGPMPSYGTPDFWAWCSKRKKLRLQKDAAIIAAGGTVKPTKPKKAVLTKAVLTKAFQK